MTTKPELNPSHIGEVWQDGICVASIECADLGLLHIELSRYAMQYLGDGDVLLKVRRSSNG